MSANENTSISSGVIVIIDRCRPPEMMDDDDDRDHQSDAAVAAILQQQQMMDTTMLDFCHTTTSTTSTATNDDDDDDVTDDDYADALIEMSEDKQTMIPAPEGELKKQRSTATTTTLQHLYANTALLAATIKNKGLSMSSKWIPRKMSEGPTRPLVNLGARKPSQYYLLRSETLQDIAMNAMFNNYGCGHDDLPPPLQRMYHDHIYKK